MKKIIIVVLALVFAVGLLGGLSACNHNKVEIALITDMGTIDDKSFNEAAWAGVTAFAEHENITHAYYTPADMSVNTLLTTIKTAVDKGARIIVCTGFMFEKAVFAAQTAYPDVHFILLDGEPNSEVTGEYKTEPNVHCILYREEEAGYLAGYAAVKDGYKKLGFLGGIKLPPVIRYGNGFIQGAEHAAIDMGLDNGSIEMQHWYSNTFVPDPNVEAKADAWYGNGTEVIFTCGGAILESVLASAKKDTTLRNRIIGVDVDQSAVDKRIITSAMKGVAESVKIALVEFYNNGKTWPTEHAGKLVFLGATENCIGLPTDDESWRMTSFTKTDYLSLFNKIKTGAIDIDNATSDISAATLNKVIVYYQ